MRLPIKQGSESLTVRTVPLYAYEADLHGTDVIIGYPFLKGFGLQVDVAHDCLKMSASLDGPTLAGPLDVDCQNLAKPLDVESQGLDTPLDVGCSEGSKETMHNSEMMTTMKKPVPPWPKHKVLKQCPRVTAPLDVDCHNLANPLDVGDQGMNNPLDVGSSGGLSMMVHAVSEAPMSTPSEHQLRCLLFCKGSHDSIDCCEHAKMHRLCHLNVLPNEGMTDNYDEHDYVRFDNPLDALADCTYNQDDWCNIPLRNLTTPQWTSASKLAMRKGTFCTSLSPKIGGVTFFIFALLFRSWSLSLTRSVLIELWVS